MPFTDAERDIIKSRGRRHAHIARLQSKHPQSGPQRDAPQEALAGDDRIERLRAATVMTRCEAIRLLVCDQPLSHRLHRRAINLALRVREMFGCL